MTDAGVITATSTALSGSTSNTEITSAKVPPPPEPRTGVEPYKLATDTKPKEKPQDSKPEVKKKDEPEVKKKDEPEVKTKDKPAEDKPKDKPAEDKPKDKPEGQNEDKPAAVVPTNEPPPQTNVTEAPKSVEGTADAQAKEVKAAVETPQDDKTTILTPETAAKTETETAKTDEPSTEPKDKPVDEDNKPLVVQAQDTDKPPVVLETKDTSATDVTDEQANKALPDTPKPEGVREGVREGTGTSGEGTSAPSGGEEKTDKEETPKTDKKSKWKNLFKKIKSMFNEKA